MPSRRGFVAAAGGALAAVAGCTGREPATTTPPGSSTPTTSSTAATTQRTTTCTTPAHETTTYNPEGPCPTDRMADVVVFAGDERETTVSLSVTRETTGEVVLEDTVETPVSGPVTYTDPIRETGVHQFAVDVAGGPAATHEWDVPVGEKRSDSWQLQVSVGVEEIRFTPVVH